MQAFKSKLAPLAVALALVFQAPFAAGASLAPPAPGGNVSRLLELSFDELLNTEVTSVAKRPQKLSQSAAAVYVITQEDIRRSGKTTIPELLRLAPGMHVAQINANTWAISARGFNDSFANKLLVLIDGRSVYSPTFSGVYWDAQDTLLENIERIEVIRGPGGTLWGANAVNGVVNIITKDARLSQGGMATLTAGNLEKGGAAAQYGAGFGDNGHFRIYAKGYERDNFVAATGADMPDAWRSARAGLRADWSAGGGNAYMLQAEAYDGKSSSLANATSLSPPYAIRLTDNASVSGGHALFRWQRSLSADSDFTLNAYFDRAERDSLNLRQRIDTYDLDFQRRLAWGERHQVVWGLNYRLVEDEMRNSFTVSFDPDRRRTQLYSAFLQDEIVLRQDLKLILGSKFEHNDYTGFEYQPNLRAVWQADEKQTLWGAVSRAVQTPSRSNSDIRINVAAIPGRPPGFTPSLVSIFGSPSAKASALTAYELGYRIRPRNDFFVDAAIFHQRYRDLATGEKGAPYMEPANLVFPSYFGNLMQAKTQGLELAANWQATRNWRLSGSYTYLSAKMQLDPASTDTGGVRKVEGNNPNHQFQLRSQYDLAHNLEFDATLQHVGKLASVPGYTRVDLRLGWMPRKNLELSLAAQNLFDRRHPEFSAVDVVAGEVPRSVYAKALWRY